MSRSASRWRAAFDLRRNVRSMLIAPAGQFHHLDGLRAISIVTVIAYHVVIVPTFLDPELVAPLHAAVLEPLYVRWAWKADYSVDVFFAISGFLIARQLFRLHARGALSLRVFYWRRFCRIYPVFAISAAVYAGFHGPNRHALWANLVFVNNLRPWRDSAMEWTWSLAVEEQFYLLFPLFLIVVFARVRSRLALLVGLLLAVIAVRAWLVLDGEFSYPVALFDAATRDRRLAFIDALYTKPYTRAGPVICGVIAAYLHHARWDAVCSLIRRRALAFGAAYAGLVGVTAYFWIVLPIYVAGAAVPATATGQLWMIGARVLVGLTAAATIVLGCIDGGPFQRWIRRLAGARLWYPIAQLSYSAYLWHIPVVYLYFSPMPDALTPGALFAAYPVVLVITFAVSAVTYLAVERPFMNLR